MTAMILPELSLVILIGPSGSGKSTFARKHFLATEVISSDFCRALITDDENDQAVTKEAFDLLHTIAAKRLEAGKLTVIDATNVQPDARKPLIELAKNYHFVPVALVFDLPETACQEHNRNRPDRQIPAGALHRQVDQLRRSLRGLSKEGFRYIYTFNTVEALETATIERKATWTNRKDEHGPFDIIGDVHGCCDELEALLASLGYIWSDGATRGRYHRVYHHPQGRKAIFLGDLVDRGPRSMDVVQLVRNMVLAGAALAVPGNHDAKLVRALQGRQVSVTHGLQLTLAEVDALPETQREALLRDLIEFLDGLISHYVLDDGRLVVAHAGMKASMQGRASARVRDFALYGETTGETDEYGLPVRCDWAADYRGKACVVYGHTPVLQPEWLNHTLNIDTGCVFGGKLTALRYPELEIVAEPAKLVYCEPKRPLAQPRMGGFTAQQQQDELLEIGDVLGKQHIETGLLGGITIPQCNSATALEVMSRFIVNPKWLIYLPPTMSPPEASSQPGYLEYPTEAFNYYRKNGINRLVCQQKHMGSRLVAVVCRDEESASKRFGVQHEGSGILYTRTGRRFFEDRTCESALIQQLQAALENSGFWQAFDTSWVCLDFEMIPWSNKSQELITRQYAPVGAAGLGALNAAAAALQTAFERGLPASSLLEKYQQRVLMMQAYRVAYRRYCWQVHDASDLQLAPFHILATEHAVHTDKTHLWHMTQIKNIVDAASGSCLLATPYLEVDLMDADSEKTACDWWKALTDAGGEGMVVKPLDFVATSNGKLLQPAIKCRGREYLRIIYGAEYSTEAHLDVLRQRHVGMKRSLTLREFALGVEGLQRFINHEPLRRIHACAFGVLALESEPVDPRL